MMSTARPVLGDVIYMPLFDEDTGEVVRIKGRFYIDHPREKFEDYGTTSHWEIDSKMSTMNMKEYEKILRGIEYVEMPDADRCCGMAGTFSVNYYELSQRIADKKLEALRAVNADVVVTGCPGCEIQLIDSSLRQNQSIKVMHIMELLK